MKTKISLAIYNEHGCTASIENEMGNVTLATNKTSKCPKACCKKAAERLRKLANAFEELAKSSSPFTEKEQNKAMKRGNLTTIKAP